MLIKSSFHLRSTRANETPSPWVTLGGGERETKGKFCACVTYPLLLFLPHDVDKQSLWIQTAVLKISMPRPGIPSPCISMCKMTLVNIPYSSGVERSWKNFGSPEIQTRISWSAQRKEIDAERPSCARPLDYRDPCRITEVPRIYDNIKAFKTFFQISSKNLLYANFSISLK